MRYINTRLLLLLLLPQIGPEVGVAWSTCRISNFWDPSTSVDRMKLRSSNLVRTSWALLAQGPQIGPRVGVTWGTCPISKFRDPLNISVG